jgi:hypothetical protein
LLESSLVNIFSLSRILGFLEASEGHGCFGIMRLQLLSFAEANFCSFLLIDKPEDLAQAVENRRIVRFQRQRCL